VITFTRLGQFGRLGNQMFQYAMLKGVEAAKGWTAKIPADGSPGLRLAEIFEIDCPRLGAGDVIARTFQESRFCFEPSAFEVEDGVDFCGCFQSERYFAHVSERIRTEFRFRPQIAAVADGAVRELRQRASCLVSLHVRHGDYLGNRAHRICDLEYYERARRIMPADATFAICSDDPAWCREAFADWPAWHCELGDAATLAVMARCDHHIIAASSFSWWGAWLNPSTDKIVLAPSVWFGPELAHYETHDLLPKSWRVI